MFGWGTSDFLANNSSGKIGHLRTFFWSQIAGLALIVAVALLHSGQLVFSGFNSLIILFVIISGISYALGYLLFYSGFEIGNVSVVSAVINLQNIFVIGIAFFFFGQRIGGVQIPGLFLLLAGVILVSVDFAELHKGKVSLLRGVKETLLAAVMFGVFFWPLNQYVVQKVDWLTINVLTKFVAIMTVFLIAFLTRKSLVLPKSVKNLRALLPLAGVGLLEATGVMSVSGGLSVGNAIIIAPIASALTVVTVGLAILFLKEKISRIQLLGISATVVGIILMSFGG